MMEILHNKIFSFLLQHGHFHSCDFFREFSIIYMLLVFDIASRLCIVGPANGSLSARIEGTSGLFHFGRKQC